LLCRADEHVNRDSVAIANSVTQSDFLPDAYFECHADPDEITDVHGISNTVCKCHRFHDSVAGCNAFDDPIAGCDTFNDNQPNPVPGTDTVANAISLGHLVSDPVASSVCIANAKSDDVAGIDGDTVSLSSNYNDAIVLHVVVCNEHTLSDIYWDANTLLECLPEQFTEPVACTHNITTQHSVAHSDEFPVSVQNAVEFSYEGGSV
jgi:hypothetical protein